MQSAFVIGFGISFRRRLIVFYQFAPSKARVFWSDLV
jgi:hypothetical protein